MSARHIRNTLLLEPSAPDLSPSDFLVRSMRCEEEISRPYEVQIVFECQIDGGLAPETIDDLLSTTSQIGFGPGGVHRFSGVFREIVLLDAESGDTHAQYSAVLVPRVWLTTMTHRSRCFNERSVPEIIRTVLEETGLADGTDFELRLTGDYPATEYVVQYRESDFAFLSRWMERLGIFYFFEQTGGREKLVLSDSNSELLSVGENSACVYSRRNDEGVIGAVHGIRRRTRRVPAVVHVRNYNCRTPNQGVSGQADVDTEHGAGLRAYVGDHVKDTAEAAAAAQLRAEELRMAKHRFYTWTVNPDFSPGFRYEVSGSPVGELDIEYLLVRVVHDAEMLSGDEGNASYRNDVESIPYSVQCRPPRSTPWPRIEGIVHAKIDAEAVNSAAPIDDQGRYRVLFPYDLYGTHGGKATRWVRKAEPYSGPAYGMHFTLHAGAEVAIAHVYGDPDRPVILGSLPNPTMVSPLTQSNATRSAIRTRSGILFDFEDNA